MLSRSMKLRIILSMNRQPLHGMMRSFIDLESGIFYRLAEGKAETNKRQPPVRLPPRLFAHLRRWKKHNIIASYVVEWEGLPVSSVKIGWQRLLDLAGFDERKITPRTLAPYRSNVADAAGCRSLGCGRLPWHESTDPAPYLWPPSS
jgi:hypothetical protein